GQAGCARAHRGRCSQRQAGQELIKGSFTDPEKANPPQGGDAKPRGLHTGQPGSRRTALLPFAGIHNAKSPLGHTVSKVALAVSCPLVASLLATATAAARPTYRGAQVHSLWSSVSASEMTRELDALQEAGANVMRVDVGWATLETAKGHYDPTYLA